MTIFTKTLTIKGTTANRDMVQATVGRHASYFKTKGSTLTIEWLCETDEQIEDFVDITLVEYWNCEVVNFQN